MKLSVLTLVRHRREHLINLMKSLDAQTQAPDELVIAWMQPAPERDLPATRFPVRHVMVEGDVLPLAKARNAAVAAARFEALVFLDVDCIASPRLVERYGAALRSRAALYLGEVHYLPADAVRLNEAGALDLGRLAALGERHPARPAIAENATISEADHGQLWGLSFALLKEDHHRAGGMDEGYIGYGGEETDYAWRLAKAKVPLYWIGGALAWHQHHPLYAPPWQHFDAIIANARRFHARWGRWCMEYWLGQFRDAGAIDWTPDSPRIDVRRQPSDADIAAARLPDSARYC
ncbi:glycosyltransferase family 2 protein [Halomonas dongshanensis]|uniref:Glycosyltransferase family 2 protein n=1 Tax=Halomonas dongshanensis TaxID=2890835 RepID=A0ABT2EFP6_9GAMM|nr:galactosyltransferase-related protein [Halomonas dongshanensis]MCS2610407.1 glycosyltransferase family 2 protein [Halomonas dongshanensis]